MGSPAAPQPWTPQPVNDWDLMLGSTNPMQAEHGADCSQPPATHPISTPNDQVFICKNHLMTATSSGYNAIYLTPSHMVDFSQGTSTVSWRVSTEHLNGRTWWDVWVTPFDENLAGPLQSWLDVAFQGPPRDALHFMENGDGTFRGELYRNFQLTVITTSHWPAVAQIVTPSATVRSAFELDISTGHVRFGMAGSQWYVDSNVSLPFTQGVIQIGHHSYNPGKDCNPDGGVPLPNRCPTETYHWSNFNISNSVPFTMLRADKYLLSGSGATVNFPEPAPPNSFLRFQDVGVTSVSFDGGATFRQAVEASTQPAEVHPEHGHSYWMPAPPGISSIVFRGSRDQYGQAWQAEDISIWSRTEPAPTSSVTTSAPPPVERSTAPTPPPTAKKQSHSRREKKHRGIHIGPWTFGPWSIGPLTIG
jgi:hypothetical protein